MPENKSVLNLNITATKIRNYLLIISIGLVLLHIIGHLFAYWTGHRSVFGLIDLVDLDREQNIPTYFSAMLLLVSTVLSLTLYIFYCQNKSETIKQIKTWLILAIVFMIFSIDEFISFHELVDQVLRGRLYTFGLPGGLIHNVWIIPGLIFIVAGLWLAYDFLRSLDRGARNSILFALGIYFGAAVGIEFLGGFSLEYYAKDSFVYISLVTLEEFGEMLGIILFIYALLNYMEKNIGLIKIKLVN